MTTSLLSIDPKRQAAHIEELRRAVSARGLVGRVVRQGARVFYRVEGLDTAEAQAISGEAGEALESRPPEPDIREVAREMLKRMEGENVE